MGIRRGHNLTKKFGLMGSCTLMQVTMHNLVALGEMILQHVEKSNKNMDSGRLTLKWGQGPRVIP